MDLSYHFDDNLHEVASSPGDMAARCDALAAALDDPHLSSEERLGILGQLGTYLRILGRLDEAYECLTRAVRLSVELKDLRAQLVNTLRLGQVFQWQGIFWRADAIFDWCLRECRMRRELADYTDFAYQHIGESLFDQGKYEEAAALFQKALQLRLEKGDPDLIASSRLALQTARAAQHGSSGTNPPTRSL